VASRNGIVIAFAALAGVLGGFSLGTQFAGPDEYVDAPVIADRSVAPPRESEPTAHADLAAALSADDLRRIVREELAADRAAARDGVAPLEDSAAPTEEQSAATSQAEALLAAAMLRREWRDSDADALREHFHRMTAGQRTEILRRFSVAVNQGRLVPQTEQIPF
jgi:hypothetical protein